MVEKQKWDYGFEDINEPSKTRKDTISREEHAVKPYLAYLTGRTAVSNFFSPGAEDEKGLGIWRGKEAEASFAITIWFLINRQIDTLKRKGIISKKTGSLLKSHAL